MVQVELTPHLFVFFPNLKGKKIEMQADTASDVVQQLEGLAPGISFYLCDEGGALRPHVNFFIGEERIVDRNTLTDRLSDGARVLIMQSLSGG
jgi:hypothetical protein